MEPKQPSKKFSKLSPVQNGKLYTWLEARKAQALTETAEKMAADATHDLGFKVTTSQLGDMRRDMGFTVAVTRGAGKQKPLDPRIITIAQAVITLSKALQSFRSQMGLGEDLDVQGIIDGK